jgi:hypothetical protein
MWDNGKVEILLFHFLVMPTDDETINCEKVTDLISSSLQIRKKCKCASFWL